MHNYDQPVKIDDDDEDERFYFPVNLRCECVETVKAGEKWDDASKKAPVLRGLTHNPIDRVTAADGASGTEG